MKTIYKYPIELLDKQFVVMPKGSKPICAQMQQGSICVWAEVDNKAEPGGVEIAIIGTGNPIPFGQWDYIGTVQQDGFVWHIYYQ